MTVSSHLVACGINCIGVLTTIDNGFYGTDVTFRFNTAVSVATVALDRMDTTVASYHRAMVAKNLLWPSPFLC
jgi:6-phosphofructokinase 1